MVDCMSQINSSNNPTASTSINYGKSINNSNTKDIYSLIQDIRDGDNGKDSLFSFGFASELARGLSDGGIATNDVFQGKAVLNSLFREIDLATDGKIDGSIKTNNLTIENLKKIGYDNTRETLNDFIEKKTKDTITKLSNNSSLDFKNIIGMTTAQDFSSLTNVLDKGLDNTKNFLSSDLQTTLLNALNKSGADKIDIGDAKLVLMKTFDDIETARNRLALDKTKDGNIDLWNSSGQLGIGQLSLLGYDPKKDDPETFLANYMKNKIAELKPKNSVTYSKSLNESTATNLNELMIDLDRPDELGGNFLPKGMRSIIGYALMKGGVGFDNVTDGKYVLNNILSELESALRRTNADKKFDGSIDGGQITQELFKAMGFKGKTLTELVNFLAKNVMNTLENKPTLQTTVSNTETTADTIPQETVGNTGTTSDITLQDAISNAENSNETAFQETLSDSNLIIE